MERFWVVSVYKRDAKLSFLLEGKKEGEVPKTMSQNGKLMPNLDEKSTKLLNLTVLQRIDPFVEEILITAAHVTFYEFNIDTSQWNLLGDFEYEVQVPYLLYRNASQEVNGIWFYNARECEEVANLFSSEFEELEAFPTLTVMDGPLEPSSSTTSNVADVPDDRAFVNFFSTAMNIGSSPNVAVSGQPYHSSATVVSAHPQNVTLPTLPSAQKPATLSSSTPIMSILENPDSNTTTKRSADLVKPSSFFGPPPSSSPLVMPPISSSVPTAPPLNPPGNIQRPYGAPLLQPFPPPTPPPSLTPTSVPAPNYGPVISREKVREALQMLVQKIAEIHSSVDVISLFNQTSELNLDTTRTQL
ncbi:hypothetical protein DH2020_028041 [Rehmannia glutinosa]|uniref:mRNA-decapping enzyme-like protein n=1 Tax=Rehmannia glutinosa TaxID=99300 RepID=A0ABR0VW44_REHGL